MTLPSRLERRHMRTPWYKKMVWLFLPAMLIMLAGCWWFWERPFTRQSPGELPGTQPTEAPVVKSDRVNILVLGVDQRNGDAGRSDTMLLVSVDRGTSEVDVISIPRDTRVHIPGHGYDKINHAYALGGHKLALKTVVALLGVPVDRYVLVNFDGFKKIVDTLGGVTIEVEKRMYYVDPYDNLEIDLYPGLQKLNGDKAIGYVRYRSDGGDISRIERQQKFIQAVARELTQPTTILRLPWLIRDLNTAIQTDLSLGEMLGMSRVLNDAYKRGFRMEILPGKAGFVGEISYWLPDIVETRRVAAAVCGKELDTGAIAMAKELAEEYERSIPPEMEIKEPPPNPPEQDTAKDRKKTAKNKPAPLPAKIRVEVKNGSGQAGVAAKMAKELTRRGFAVVDVGNADNFNYPRTIIIDHTGNSRISQKLKGLPFKYTLNVAKDGVKQAELTIIVGKDYK